MHPFCYFSKPMEAKLSFMTTLLISVTLAGACTTRWDDGSSLEDAIPLLRQPAQSSEYSSEECSERSPMSLMQVALTVGPKRPHSADTWSTQQHDVLNKQVTEQSHSAVYASEEGATSMSKARSSIAGMAAKTASKALSNASSILGNKSAQKARSAEDSLSAASIHASDLEASQVAGTELAQTQGHYARNQTEAKATDSFTMLSKDSGLKTISHDGFIKEGSPPVHPSWAAFPRRALRFVKDVMVPETFFFRVAILIACLAAVKVLHHTLEHSAAEYREWQAKRNMASGANVKPSLRKKPVNRDEELTAQQLVAGRGFFDRELHPGHPDLYEPSPFHQDIDPRRVVKGGE